MLRMFPDVVLGVVIALYWARVVRMAYKARRRSRQGANFVPRERLGRLLRIIWIPVVAVWVVHPFLLLLPHLPAPLRPLYFQPWIAWFSAGVAAACLALSRICWKTMGKHWRMGIDPSEHNPLIASGPFSWVRHPIYALSALMMLATMAAVATPLMLIAGTLHVLLLLWEAGREEQHLLRLHGQAYALYCQRVGGFIPKPAPRT